jgi:hypothetical protein
MNVLFAIVTHPAFVIGSVFVALIYDVFIK